MQYTQSYYLNVGTEYTVNSIIYDYGMDPFNELVSNFQLALTTSSWDKENSQFRFDPNRLNNQQRTALATMADQYSSGAPSLPLGGYRLTVRSGMISNSYGILVFRISGVELVKEERGLYYLVTLRGSTSYDDNSFFAPNLELPRGRTASVVISRGVPKAFSGLQVWSPDTGKPPSIWVKDVTGQVMALPVYDEVYRLGQLLEFPSGLWTGIAFNGTCVMNLWL